MIALILVIGKVDGLLIYPRNRVVGSTSSTYLSDHWLRLADFSNTGIGRTTYSADKQSEHHDVNRGRVQLLDVR